MDLQAAQVPVAALAVQGKSGQVLKFCSSRLLLCGQPADFLPGAFDALAVVR